MKKNPFAVKIGRKGGQVTSAAKRAAARENGKLGGRPPKQGAK
jgi:general stress protein YciG